MKIFAYKGEQAGAQRRAFRLSPVAAGCAVLLSAMAAPVYAQQADQAAQAPATADQQAAPAAQPSPAPQGQNAAASAAVGNANGSAAPNSVVVTGIRRGIEAAISIKKNSTSIVEAISAEDIGKLPDASVAASIARLPGVTAQRSRDGGRASDISVRGLSPSFNGTLLNGREQASTGNARSPEFDLFPAELMGSVLIYKTPDATLVGQGLASTIDLHTVQPLDFGKRTMAARAEKSRLGVGNEGLPEGDGSRYSFSYIDQFADRTIGVAIGLTKYKENGGAQRKFDSWGGGTQTVQFNGQDVKIPGGFTADTEVNKNNRDGAFASLQFRPNRNFKSTLDLFYSSGHNENKKTGLEAGIGFGTGGAYDNANPAVLTAATVANGFATSGTLTNWRADVRNHIESADDDLKTAGWNNEWKVGEWTAALDLTYSKATKQSTRYETTAGLPGNGPGDTLKWTGFNGTNFTDVAYTTGVNYSDRSVVKLTDVHGWSGGTASPQAGYVALPHIDDKVQSIRMSAKKPVEWGPVINAQFGYNYTKRDKARTGDEGRLMIKGGDPFGTVTVPGNDVVLAGTPGFPVAAFDPSGSLGTIYELAQKVDADILTKYWGVTEKVNTFYVMGDLEGKLGNYDYRGNIGLQAIHTDQRGSGFTVDKAGCTGNTAATCPGIPVSDGEKYWDVLPSANVSFDLGHEQQLRFGVAKILSRPNLDDLRASQTFSVSTSGVPILVGSGGNAKLKPFRAKSFDVSYEKYFGNKGYVSLAGFYKKLDNYILRAPMNFDFAPWVSPTTPLPLTGPYKGSTQGLLTMPTNGDGGNIHGFELAVNVPFSMVSEYLDGFGVMANYSDTSSGIELPLAGFGSVQSSKINIPLPGLSKRVSNLRLYYEKYGFQFAAAARKRSDFLGQVSDFQDNAQLVFIKGETIVDLQMSYEFQKGWLEGFSVYAQANNWNKASFQQFTESPDSITNQIKIGRTYQFGLNYKFQ